MASKQNLFKAEKTKTSGKTTPAVAQHMIARVLELWRQGFTLPRIHSTCKITFQFTFQLFYLLPQSTSEQKMLIFPLEKAS